MQEKKRFTDIFSEISDYCFIEAVKNIWPNFGEFVQLDGDISEDYYTNHTRHYKICAYCLTNMMIHSNGDIGVCSHDWSHSTAYANVRDISICEAWNSDKLRKIQIEHLAGNHGGNPFCRNCSQVSYDNVDEDAAKIISNLER